LLARLKLYALAVIATCLLGLAGCHPQPRRLPGSFVNIEGLSEDYRPQLCGAEVRRADLLKSHSVLFVEQPAVSVDEEADAEYVARSAEYLRAKLLRELIRIESFDIVTLDRRIVDLCSDKYDILVLSIRMTDASPGSAWARYFLGLIPFASLANPGATDHQFEGRITDQTDGTIVVEFVDRRRESVGTFLGPSLHTFKREYVMRVAITSFCKGLSGFLKGQREDSGQESGSD